MKSQGQRAWFPLAVIVLLTLSAVARADVPPPDPTLSPQARRWGRHAVAG